MEVWRHRDRGGSRARGRLRDVVDSPVAAPRPDVGSGEVRVTEACW
ncbi:MAG: hypothetical protein QF719_03100 [Chloroflexota bacterium]|nr:hypothetical protein [Chloroflexota bacterium]MDP6508084.1 hypothetical protein [Chloroflexota bacterium]MDP6757189.1 hypothetical protein [Chloroflexota bacterium]